ncbi:MAG: hypothetical protein EOM03_18280 [Clostridia bacterium]|nr:hypothetical protein [Clostridia bacterium]
MSAGYTDSRIRLLRVVGQVANALIDNISIQRLLPATCTVAAVVTAGASSAETTADSNILTGRDTVASLLYFASGGVIKSNDGTTAASVTVTDGWDAGQKFLIVIEYGPTTYRVGYLKVGAETALTFGDAASSDGSYNPLTHIRAALTSTLPLHLGGIQTWEEAATLADITKYFKQAGVL